MERKKLKRLADFFKKQKEVKVAYLFGSAAKGTEGKLSDIDIAVYLDEKLSESKRFDIRLKLISDISSILKTDKIDVVVMNDSPIILNYEIIKYNFPLFVKKKFYKIMLEHSILSNYLDRRFYDKRSSEHFLRRISERGKL